MTIDLELLEIRKSIDNLDNAIIAILAERFRLTERVGLIKSSKSMPAEDTERELIQELHYSKLASSYGLDKGAVIAIMKSIIAQVKNRHNEIKNNK
jgi:chorismate mutase